MKPLLLNRKPIVDPLCSRDCEKKQLSGIWWRVMPETARDVEFLQCLGDHQRYSPWEGEGIIVSDNCIPKYQ